ncbi:LysR family transcriptional regulator [Rossellomorea sp. NPDC077527]|uniref:LysR family transcriptional regulator n=1 Tax=Rossellomorea sp. NPDC077527 TaxID=3364510 RepID=UPI0037C62ECB
MQLDWIRTFVTLAQLQHFTKTSEYLNLSQPTVSVHVKKLEQTLRTELIHRSSTNQHFELTRAGEQVFEKGKEMMDLWRSMEQINEKKEEIPLRIGSTHTVSDVLLPDFVKKIKVLYPQVQLQLMIHNHETIVEALNSNEVDLALVEGTRGLEPFHVEVISRDELRFFASSRMNPHSSPFILREQGSGTREYADDFLKSERIVPVEILEASSHFLIKQLAVRGLGIAFLSSSMVKDEVLHGKLVPIEPYIIHRPFYAVHPEHATSISLIRELVSLIENPN